jgi:hypothetical protein
MSTASIIMRAPMMVIIDAPMVLIKGNLQVAGGIVFGPMCKPVT